MAVVYRHIRLDTNEVFYVGIGTEERAYTKRGRNRHWLNIANKCGYSVEITHTDLIREEAMAIEKYLIAFYGRKDLGLGPLVNMTDGGDGCLNQSEETRKLRSRIMKGENNHRYGVRLSEESKKHLSELWKGKVFSPETRALLSKRQKERPKGIPRGGQKVIDKSTGQIFNSISEVAKHLNKSIAAMSLKLNGRLNNNTSMVLLKEYNNAA